MSGAIGIRSVSCPEDSPEARRSSAEKLVAGVLDDVEFADVLRATLFNFTPVHNQSQQCKAVSRFLGKDEETVRRWAHEITSPKAKDVWPLFFVVLLQSLPIETQQMVMAAMLGQLDE